MTPAAPGFSEVNISPRIHDSVGPRSVGGRFLSPKGMISSSWRITGSGAYDDVELSVGLPVGVRRAAITVPKPTTNGKPSAVARITLAGKEIWNGSALVGNPAGIMSASDGRNGVVLETTNGVFEFVSSTQSDL